jgi:hypothetical protein
MWSFSRVLPWIRSPRPLTRAASTAFRPAVEALEGRTLLDASAFVRGLYADILHRPTASQPEIDSWVSAIKSGVRKEDVVHAFVESNEHFARTVSDDFQRFLGRDADPASRDFWVRQMAAGMREDQVEDAILASPEYRARHGGTDDGFLNGLYQEVLHRGADDAGKAFWTNQLQGGMNSFQVAAAFAASHEAHARDVDGLYLEILHRQADDAGRAAAVDDLDRGDHEFHVEEIFADSNEYGSNHP